MLFDLFACFSFGEDKVKSRNPFKDLDPYRKMMFARQESVADDAYLISLHKRHDDNFPVHEDDQYQVRIFGYCFVRADNNELKDRSRLSANRIAQIYDDYGSAFVEKIKGSFSILIFDKRKKELLVFTDPLNVRPLYYSQKASQFMVSSSVAAIAKALRREDAGLSVNYPALIEHQLFGYILNDDTFLKDVFAVSPGSCLKFDKAGLGIKPYWDSFKTFASAEIEHSNEQVAIDKLEAILRKNLDLYLFDSDRTAFALTGGLNSRTNLALLENKAKDFLFYTYGGQDNPDILIATKIAKTFSLRSKPILFDETFQKNLEKNSDLALGLGDGMSEIKHIYTLFAYKEIAKSYDYVLTGFFGSELLTPPQLQNLLINKQMREVLDSSDKEQTMVNILEGANLEGVDEDTFARYKNDVIKRVLANPFIVNEENTAQKYFNFILMIAARKLLMKEVKVEKSYVRNLHPFLDIEYIELLVRTPFSWIHSWPADPIVKDVRRSERLHAHLMHRNKPRLNNVLSTSGYTPRYLLKNSFSPMMKLEYFYNKKKVTRQEGYCFNNEILAYLGKNVALAGGSNKASNQANKEPVAGEQSREIAMKYWLETNQLA